MDRFDEAFRIVKDGGSIVIGTLETLPDVDNFILKSFIENFRTWDEIHAMDSEKIENFS